MSDTVGDMRPETTVLTESQKDSVRTRLSNRNVRCGSCGSTRFSIGDAMYLGFLFLSEPLDSYMVALTCTNPDCGAPRTGLTLCAWEFLGQRHVGG